MMNVSTLTVLLVCVILECAHSASLERGWERLSPRSKRSAVNRVSVVESWNSVCEEVCSAGYGGLGCGCSAQASGYSDKFNKICPNLCENALGTTKCSCESSHLNPHLPSARKSLCSATCSWKKSLSGCSKCFREDVSTTDGDDSPTTTDEITDEYGTTNTTDTEATVTEEYSTDEEDTTTDSNEDDSTTEEATTTISTTTTTQPTTTTRTTTQATTTTTPNWESMCEALCRNGEGGSLCNCDIPPFF
ncbi:A-agglutinin anchorage subunit [Bradysia coprophila]|uniref:A-agglutinin anchorage subunit n=1 Tax=Bradysia coprophila TaxID=38358 RepID=UPI00187DC8CA|nr:A-agglutinin anchorage subunit [Bradysia coprophila]